MKGNALFERAGPGDVPAQNEGGEGVSCWGGEAPRAVFLQSVLPLDGGGTKEGEGLST